MDLDAAHSFIHVTHAGQRTRFGESMIDHLTRVAAAVPAHARVAALLHDVLERDPAAGARLRAAGLSETELATLELLTHVSDEAYEEFVDRIACASGPEGQLARLVKLADVDDHLSHPEIPADAPPYADARARLLAALARGNPSARAA